MINRLSQDWYRFQTKGWPVFFLVTSVCQVEVFWRKEIFLIIKYVPTIVIYIKKKTTASNLTLLAVELLVTRTFYSKLLSTIKTTGWCDFKMVRRFVNCSLRCFTSGSTVCSIRFWMKPINFRLMGGEGN